MSAMRNKSRDVKKVIAPSIAEWNDKDLEDIDNTNEKDTATGGSAMLSMSIDETNKLRAKLGLKPLEIDSKDSVQDGENEENKKEWVHEPAVNIGSLESQEKLREKLAVLKEKRQHIQQFKKVKNISEQVDDSELSNTSLWVEKMRKLQSSTNIKKHYHFTNKTDDINICSKNLEPSTDGLAIAHKLSEFDNNDETETILVLKDSNVLDDEEDILENIQLNEIRQSKINIRNKNIKSTYNPYGDDEENLNNDNFSENIDNEFNNDRLLAKYNEQLDKSKVPITRIGTQGLLSIDGQAVSVSEQLSRKYGSHAISLNSSNQHPTAIKDYFTHEEMIKMKPRKRKKLKTKVISMDIKSETDNTTVDEIVDFHKRKLIRTVRDTTNDVSKNDINESVIDDPVYNELEIILSKSRSRVQKYQPNMPDISEKIYEQVITKSDTNEIEMKEENEEMLVMDDIREFVRSHTTRTTTSQAYNNRQKLYGSDSDDSVDPDETNQNITKEKSHNTTSSNEGKINQIISECDLGKGIAVSLEFAKSKGYIQEDKKVLKTYKSNLPETIAVVDEERTKGVRNYPRSATDRYDSNNRFSFPEKINYDPEIKLENVDKFGNVLSEKEAFRVLSHKFHGNRPGKLKQYKRKKKALKNMADSISSIGSNNTENALKVYEVISEKQKSLKTPYLVLSGSAKGNMINGSNKLSKK